MPTDTTPKPHAGQLTVKGFTPAELHTIKVEAAKAGIPVYKWAAEIIKAHIAGKE